MNKITIKYYRKSVYGQTLEYIHPDNKGEAQIIRQLTGKTTITSVVRELLRDLTGSFIEWVEVPMP